MRLWKEYSLNERKRNKMFARMYTGIFQNYNINLQKKKNPQNWRLIHTVIHGDEGSTANIYTIGLKRYLKVCVEVDKIEFVGGPKYLWTTELQIENFIPDSLIRM